MRLWVTILLTTSEELLSRKDSFEEWPCRLQKRQFCLKNMSLQINRVKETELNFEKPVPLGFFHWRLFGEFLLRIFEQKEMI